jgi:gas vesicle protein GvpL/GvpF
MTGAGGGGGPCYVYGIVLAAAPVPGGLAGVGKPASLVTAVPCGRVAAVISPVAAERPLGTPADLRAHAGVLDALARSASVLPMQFGGVLAGERAVVTELLEPHEAAFAERLDLLAGHDQFTVKGRYEHDAALREILAEEPGVMGLRERLREQGEASASQDPASRGEAIRMGELVARALERKQAADTGRLARTLAPHAAAVAEHAPATAGTAADVAFLVARARQDAFEQAAQELGRAWQDRIRLRLVGPLAPYDFASLPQRWG